MSELAGRLVVIKVSGDPLAFTDEATSTTDDQTYQIDDETKRVWDKDADITVKEGVTETTEDYTLNRLEGTITFASADSERDVVTVSGQYLPMSEAASAHNYNYDRGVDLLEVTAFRQEDPANPGDYIPSTHKKRIPGHKFASGSINKWDVVDSYFRDALTDGSPVVLEFRGQDTGDPQRLWALLESAEMAAAIDSPQDEAVSFISTDELLNIS